MKIRSGFVSNSSSSSFVVLGYEFDYLNDLFEAIKKRVPDEWKQLMYKLVVDNGLCDSPNDDAVNINERYILTAVEDGELEICNIVWEIVRMLGFNDHLVNGDDSPIYIGNSIQIAGDCDLVINDITTVKNIMMNSKYYEPDKLRIHVLFAGHSSEYYQPIEDLY